MTVTALDTTAPQSIHRRRFRWRGGVGGVLLLPAALISLFSAPLLAATSWLHLAVQTLAWATFVAGASFRFWATLYVGGRKEHELVIDGPYSVCRHPLYLGSLLLGLSAGLFLESPAFLAVLVVVGALYMRGTVPVEERVLRDRHAQRYEAYVSRVPRYWPRGFRVRSPAQITVDVHALWLECARASRWMWLPILGALFTHLRTLIWWPKVFRSF